MMRIRKRLVAGLLLMVGFIAAGAGAIYGLAILNQTNTTAVLSYGIWDYTTFDLSADLQGATGPVTWTTSNVPATIAASFNAGADTNATLTLRQLNNGPDAGTYTMYVNAQAASGESNQITITLTVTPRALTLAGTFTAQNKVYDRSTAASINANNLVIVDGDILDGDDVSFTPTLVFANANVGNAKTVTVSPGSALSGAQAGNYTLSVTGAPTATANITAKPLTVTPPTFSKTYDGNTTATASGAPTLVGIESGDTVTVTGTPTYTYSQKGVGTGLTVTPSVSYGLGGSSAGNYSVTQPSMTGTISQRSLSITFTGTNRPYDATTVATVTASSDTRVSGDVLGTISASGANFTQAGVGTGITVNISGISANGADAANYVMPSSATTTANITARQVTVGGTLTVPSTRVYDSTVAATITDASTLTLVNVVGADSANLSLASPVAAYATKTVGAGKTVSLTSASLGGSAAPNYSLSVAGAPTASAAITAKALNVTIATADRTYNGLATATVTYLDDRISGDSLTVSGTATFSDKHVGTGKTVTATGISLSGADAANYSPNTSATTTASITPRSLSVTLSGGGKTYDGNTTAPVTFLDNRVSGDSLTVSGTATFASKTVGAGKTISATGISLSGADAGDYTANSTASATATITARSLAVGITTNNKTYDGLTTATVTYTDNRVSGDSISITGTATFASKTVANGKTVTASSINVTGADSTNYTWNTTATGTANITARTLTVGITTNNKTYDGLTTATVTYTDDRVSGDSISITGTATFASKTVANGKTVTASSINVTGADSTNYTWNTSATGTANITARTLTIVGTYTASNRAYDGTTDATGNVSLPASPSLSGVQATDNVTLTGTPTFTFASANVGTSIAITGSGYSLGGTDAANYVLTQPTTNAANITARTVTIGGTLTVTSTRVYDGTLAANVSNAATLSLSNVASADSGNASKLAIATVTAQYATKAVGTGKTVSVTAATLSGTSMSNYTVSVTGAPTATAAITARTLNVTAGGVHRTYNQNTSAVVLLSDDRVSGDTLTTSYTSASFADKNVGTGKTVSVTGISVTGADSGNYTWNTTTTTTANITARGVSVTITASNKVYDGLTTAAVTYSDTRLAGDIFTVTGTATFASKAVGVGKTVTASGITLTGADAANYSPNSSTTNTATITARTLAVTITSAGKTYDGLTSATVTYADDRVSGDALTVTGTATYATKTVGTGKTITAASISVTGADSGNYTWNSSTTTTASITARTLAVSITPSNKTYDALTSASVTYGDNRVAGDSLSVTGTATFADKLIGTAKTVTATGITVTGADSGNYTWNTTATNTANITARALTIVGTYTASNRVYDGTTAATGNVSVPASPTLATVQGSDSVALSGTPTFTFASANVGTAINIITSGYSLTGADAGNYTLTAPTLSANITTRAVTIGGTLVVASTRSYNQSAVATITDSTQLTIVNVATADAGNASKLALASLAAAYPDKNAGTNRTVSLTTASLTGTSMANYSLSLVGAPTATSTITPRSLLVTITAASKVYNSSDAASVTYTDNRISGDIFTVSGTATFSDANIGTGKQVTASGITLTGADSANYSQNTTANTTANITSRTLTITGTFTASNKVYDGTTAANGNVSVPASPGLSGVQGADDVALAGSPVFTFSQATVGTNLTITTSGYSLSGTTAGNYTLTQPTYTASITTRTVTIGGSLVVNSTKTYDSTTAITITDSSQLTLVNVPAADAGAPSKISLTGLVAQYSSKTVGTGKTVSLTAASITGTTSSNYLLSMVGAPTTTADVTLRSLNVTITASNKVYNASTAASVTYSDNRVSGDSFTVSGTATFADKNIGMGKTVTASSITLTGTDAGNYTPNNTATNTANITARPLTVTGTFTIANRQYDATTDANGQVTVPVNAGLSDVQVGDDATLAGTPTFTFARATIGNSIAISTTGYSVTGADAGNYALTQPSFSANITARPLTIGGALVVSPTKTYNQSTASTITDSAQLTLVNVPSGDANNAAKVALTSLTATYSDKNVGTGKTVSLATAQLTGTTASNYTLTTAGAPTTTADITAKALVVTITPSSKTYDQTTTASVTYGDNRISGDSFTVSGTATFSDKNVGTGKQVTANGITLTGGDATNYSQNTTATNTANITARALAVTITASSKTYDQTTAATVTYGDNRISGDSFTVSGTATFASKTYGLSKQVTASGITLTGTDAANYSQNTSTTTTANITKKTLNVTITALNKVYDRTTTATVTYLDDRITGDVLTVTGTPNFNDKTVATGKTVTATGIAISGADAVNYTQNTTATTTADITAKSLNVTITASSKVYNASDAASVTYSDNRITGDSLTVSGTATFSDKTAANGKTVTANGISLSGADAANYSQNTTATNTANITKRPLTVTGTFTVANRAYDATTDATPQVTLPVSAGLSDVQAGDDATLTGTPAFTFAQATVGTGIAISTSGYSVSGADAANYALTQPSFSANITQRPVTIGGSLVVSSTKTYDRGTASTITTPSALTLVNVPAGDANNAAKVGLTSLTAVYADKTVGTGKTVSLATASLTGTTSANYSLSMTGAPTTTADITAKSMNVTITAASRTYNQLTAATVTYSDNRISGDSLVVSGTANFSDKNVGSGKTVTATGISLSGADAANYTPNTTATNTANITAKSMAVTITASNKVYDALTAASVTYSDDRIAGDSLTVTGTATFANKNVGAGKTVTANGISLSGTDAANYTPNTSTTTTASITQRTLAVTATAANKTYDALTAASVTYADDRRPSDILNIAGTANFDTKNIGTGKTVSVTGISVTGTDAGNYTWNTTTSTTADITIRTLAVTAVADTKVYDSTTAATATYSDNRVAGDVLSVTGTATFSTKVVGTTKAVSIVDISVTGTDAGNYTWNTTTSSTADITQRPLQVTGTLQAQDKVYDGLRTATYNVADLTLVGVQGSDAVGVSNPRGRFRTNANVGVLKTVELTSYQLTGADLGNYAVTVDNSPITYATITARPLNVTITATNKTYDGSDSASVTYLDDRVAGDVLTVSGTATFSDKNVGTAKTVTANSIAITGTAAGNYSQNTTATTTANITSRSLVVTISTSNKTYDGNTAASVTYSDNRVSGDILTVSGTATFASKTVGVGKTVTASSISLAGTDAGNYTQNTSTTGTATITARPLVVTITAPNRTYDRTVNSSVTFADDRVSGDILTVSGTATFASKTVGVGKTVTATGISITGTDAANYSQNTTATTTADITAKTLNVTITASSKVYNASDVASVTYADDRISGDSLTVSGTATFSDKTAANGKTVTASGITLTGTDAANYSQNTTATATANITKRGLTVTGTFTVANRAYDATTDATAQVTLPVTAGLSAVQGADDTTLTGTPVFTFAQATVGNGIAISTSGYSLAGADAANYTLTQPSFTANITQRPLTIGGSLVVASTRTYDRTTASAITDASQLTLVNVPAGDSGDAAKVALASPVAQYSSKTVGTGKTVSLTSASLSGTTAPNYTLGLTGSPTTTADITARALNVTITASNKTYDQTDAASVTYADNRVSGDIFTVGGTATFSDKNAGAGKTVTANNITLTGADAGNYTQNTSTTTTATINKKALAVTITASNKTYDQTTAASVTYLDDRITGDVLTVSGTATFASKTYGVGKTVTASSISLAGTDAGNYTQNTSTTTTATINKKALAVTITASNKTYDRTTSASVTYLDDRITGDVLTVSGTPAFSDKNVGTGKTVTATGISIAGADAGNYTQNTSTTTTADITAKALVVTIAASNKTYDQSASASVSYSDNRIAGDSFTVSGTATFPDKNVGTGRTVTASGIALTGTDAGNYAQNTSATTTANITARALAVTMTASNKTYDRTTAASVTYSDNRIAGDSFTVSGTATFASKTIGTGKTVTATSITLTGTDAGNYAQNTSTTATASITARALAVTATAANKTYDRTTAASVTIADDRVSGDIISIAYTSSTFADKTVANGKTVTVAGISISGADAANYSANTSTTTTADITARTLNVTITPANKTYDGTDTASVTFSDNRVSGDILTVSGTATYSDKTVDTGKSITVSGLSISGVDSSNYVLPSVTANAATTANITARTITITGIFGVTNRQYDATTDANGQVTPPDTPGLSDVQLADDVTLTGSPTFTFAQATVGNGIAISTTGYSLSGADAANYALTQPSFTANITPRPLTVGGALVVASTRTYDRTTSSTITSAGSLTLVNVPAGDANNASKVGLASLVARYADKNVGAGKPVTLTSALLSGTTSSNYTLSLTGSPTTTADITAKALNVTITASNKTYDQGNSASVTYSDDRITGDSFTVSGTATFPDKNVGNGRTVTASGIALTGADAANYAQNTSATATANITAKTLNVTIAASNKTYDRTTAASVTYSDDRIDGDSFTVSGTATFSSKTVGNGKTVTASGITLTGADAANYAQNTSTTTTANITLRTLNVTATASNKTYDRTTAASVTISDDRVTGDTVNITYGSSTFSDKTVGNAKTVTVSGISISGADAANYAQNTSTTATANITAKTLNVTIAASNKTYDGSASVSVTYSDDRITGDSFTVTGTPSFSDKTVGNAKTVTATGIAISGADAANYTQNTTATTTANITLRTLNVTATASNKTYDRTTAASVTISDDRVAGDTVNIAYSSSTFSDKTVGNAKTVTVSGISISGADAANYTQNTTATTTANITAKALTVTVTASNKTYDRTTAASVTYADDRIAGDTLTVTGTPVFSDKTVGNAKTVTVTGISISGADAANYTQNTTATTTANITAKALTVTVTASNKTYDRTTAASVTISDDRVAGDTVNIAYSSSTFSDKNVGNAKTVTVSGISISGADAANYTQNTTATTTANITAKALTVTVTASNKTYDRTTAASVTYADDRIAGDTLTVTGTPVFSDKTVGNAKTVTVTGISISGADAANYTQNTTATTTANITAKALTVTVTASNKTYNGNAAASVTTSDDRITGDILTVGYTGSSFTDKNVGNAKTVTVSGISISGADAANYVQNTTATTTANISARVLAIGIVADDKQYDATNTATVTFTDNRVSGDSLTVTGTSTFSDKNVANGKIVTATGISVTGVDAANYSHAASATTTATITRRPLVVTAVADSKRYDATNAATAVYGDDRIAGDIFTASGTATFPDDELGTARPVTIVGITLTGADAGNYLPNATTMSSADIFVRTITASVPAATADTPLAVARPTVQIGQLVPGTDTRVTFTKSGATVVCALMPTDTAATCIPDTLSDGTWSYRATQTINGLMVAASPTTSVTIDTTAPVFTKGPVMAAGSDSADAADNVTNKNTPTVVVNDAAVGDTAVVTATSAGGTAQCTFVTTASKKSCALPVLADGTWTVTAQLTDRAGNRSNTSSALSVTVDTVAPAPPAAPLNGAENSSMSTDSTPRIVVNGVTAGDTATVTGALPGKLAATCSFVAAAAVNSCDMSKMTGGTWSLTATATDVAGNVSASSAPTRLIVSAALAPAAPTTPVLQPVTASLVSNATTLNFGTSAALAGIQTVTFVVTNDAGKVVRTTTIMPKPNDTKASIEIPKDLKGAKVQVYTTNQCGVSANAPKNVNVSRGKTASQKAPYGVPTPKGDMVLPAIDFAASEITLDDADKAALDKVAKAVGDRCGTLLVTGYSRFNDKDSKKYLQNLADFRAKAVSDYLSRIGVDMWIVYRGYVVKAGENDAQRFRRAEIRWVPA